MNKIELLDLSSFNCWIVYLKPNNDYEKDLCLQKACISGRIFGMGWPLEGDRINEGSPCTQALQELYLRLYHNNEPENALNLFAQIQAGDIVMMRLLDGHYYIARISSGPIWLCNNTCQFKKQLSWGCQVEKWYEIKHEKDVPSEIRGRFSQQRHATVQRIAGHRMKILTKALFDSRENADKKTNMPLLSYTQTTFIRSLDYMQLEDLVYLYIKDQKESENYIFLPSSGKTNQQKYEFRLVCEGKNDITCQVKNQAGLDLKQYKNDSHFQTIYVFSGEWSEDKAKEEQEKCEQNNIKVILPSELYKTLLKYEWLFCNQFYAFDQGYPSAEDLLQELKCNDAFEEIIKGRRFPKLEQICNEKKIGFRYTEEGSIIFDSNWNLFYAPETGKLIKAGHFADEEKENKICELIVNRING